MRPLELSFSGIRSYPGKCGPLDFTGRSLVGVLGDTGAGKSTILEAITYALYGTCTWHGDASKYLIAEGAAAMSVDLVFAHGDERWRAHRITHTNTTPSTHLLRNLDTGEEVSNRRPMDARIAALLKMDYASFQAAVLLPQGRFDRLLTATDSERPQLLKGIFGVEAVEAVRGQAGRDSHRLKDLLHKAETARSGLYDDPAGTAARAAQEAGEHRARAERLTAARNAVRELRQRALAVRGRLGAVEDLAGQVGQQRVGAVEEVLARTGPAERELVELHDLLDQDQKRLKAQLEASARRSAEAAERGHTPDTLGAAAILLSGAGGRLAGLSGQREALAADQRRLTEQQKAAAAAEARVPQLAAVAERLAERAAAAAAAAEDARGAWSQAQEKIGAALGQAVNTAGERRKHEESQQHLASLRAGLPPLREAETRAQEDLRSAERHLDSLRRGDAAHSVGADLSAGADCPVCARELPAGYQPPDSVDAEALETAEDAKSKGAVKHRKALRSLDKAEAELASAEQALSRQADTVRGAEERLERAIAAALQTVNAPVWATPPQGTPPLDRASFAEALRATADRLAADDPEEGERQRAQVQAELLEPLHRLGKALGQAEKSADEAARTARGKADSTARESAQLKNTWEQAAEALTRQQQHHSNTSDQLRGELEQLPPAARDQLPGEVLGATEEHFTRAQRAVAELRAELDGVVRARDQANEELKAAAEQRLTLKKRHDAEVAEPLRRLLEDLGRWAAGLTRLHSELDAADPLPSLPTDPRTEPVARCAAELAEADARLSAKADSAASELRAEAAALLEDFTARAAALREETGVGIPDRGEALLGDGALDALTAAASAAATTAGHHEAEQRKAEAQIPKAAVLDTALTAGRARYQAVDTLRAQLADAKFPNYLTERRTRALLGLASDLLAELSGGQLGFTGDFHIANLSTQAARDPRTLSGGETFLASLALALALVELYSRTGARLGALFLDEGFGSLDADTLTAALGILRAKTGGDKLVTVISHLHAVAEAVDDVLWVERGPAGSAARWLTPGERDALVNQDVSGGLLELA